MPRLKETARMPMTGIEWCTLWLTRVVPRRCTLLLTIGIVCATVVVCQNMSYVASSIPGQPSPTGACTCNTLNAGPELRPILRCPTVLPAADAKMHADAAADANAEPHFATGRSAGDVTRSPLVNAKETHPPVASHVEAFSKQWNALLSTGIDGGVHVFSFDPKMGVLTPAKGAHCEGVYGDGENEVRWRPQGSLLDTRGSISVRTYGDERSVGVSLHACPDTFHQVWISASCTSGGAAVTVTDTETGQLLAVRMRVAMGQRLESYVMFRTLGTTRRITLAFTFGRNDCDAAACTCSVYNVRMTQLAPSRQFTPPGFLRGMGADRTAPSRTRVNAVVTTRGEYPPWALTDTINSVYPFVDSVRVFVAGRSSEPDSLSVPATVMGDAKVAYVTSELWGDRGDGNALFWAARNATDGDYTLVVGEGVLLPADYVARAVAGMRDHGNRAFMGTFCAFVPQPITRYFRRRGDTGSMTPKRAIADDADYAVHVIGTENILFPSRMLPGDVPFLTLGVTGVADMWLALKAQEMRIPMVCLPSPDGWVTVATAGETNGRIPTLHATSNNDNDDSHNNSSNEKVLRFLDEGVRDALPLTTQPTVRQGSRRLKLVIALSTMNRKDTFARWVVGFLRTRSTAYDWTVIICDDGSTDGTRAYLDRISGFFPHQLFVVRTRGRYRSGQANAAFEIAMKIGFDVGFRVEDSVDFLQRGWDELYVNAILAGPYAHLAFQSQSRQQASGNRATRDATASAVMRHLVSRGAVTGASVSSRVLWTFTPDVLRTIGYIDELNFPSGDDWQLDFSVRACRAGFNSIGEFYDAAGSEDFIGTHSGPSATTAESDAATASNAATVSVQQLGAEEMAAPMNAWELARRHTVIHNSGRLFVPHRRPLLGRHGDWQSRRIAPNDVFDKIYVMNLDRRQDRWESVVSQTKRIGLGVHRFSAVDGYASPHKEEWDAYSRQPIVPHPEGRMGVRSVRFGSEYELDYDSTVARVAFMENRLQQKVLKTPGAWGYAKTYAAILKDAISSGHDRILILDDDSLFHRNFTDLFDIMYREVPADWKVLQLGSMQYSWNNKHVQWVGPHLYMNWGTGVGSHAVGIDRSVFLEMLALSTRPTMPVDEGALHTVVRKHPLHCFVAFPNLIVQNSMLASDINSSVASEEDRRGKNWDKFKWTREDYEDMDASTSGGATTRDNATVTQ